MRVYTYRLKCRKSPFDIKECLWEERLLADGLESIGTDQCISIPVPTYHRESHRKVALDRWLSWSIVYKYTIITIYIYLYYCQSDLTSWFTSMTDSGILDCHQGNSIMLPPTLISYELVWYKYTSSHVMDSLWHHDCNSFSEDAIPCQVLA